MISKRVFDTFLGIAIEEDEKREKNRAAWIALAALYAELLRSLDNPEEPDQQDTKAKLVQGFAVVYVKNFAAAVGRELCTLYTHLAMDHILDMVRRFPINFSDLLQHFVEAAMKAGKTDMHVFTNKQLRGKGMDKGRNFQCFSKERERGHLKRTLPVPLTRNERRVLGSKSKVAAEIVEMTRQRGQLASRSKLQLEKRVDKTAPDLLTIVKRVQEASLTSGSSETAIASTHAAGEPNATNLSPASAVEGSVPAEAAGAGDGAGGAGRGGRGGSKGGAGSESGAGEGRGSRGGGGGGAPEEAGGEAEAGAALQQHKTCSQEHSQKKPKKQPCREEIVLHCASKSKVASILIKKLMHAIQTLTSKAAACPVLSAALVNMLL
jgi:uncharacterized membrane protein YgcG